MPPKPSFTDAELSAVVVRLAANGERLTTRAVRLGLNGGSTATVLRSYRRCLRTKLGDGDPVIDAAAKRLQRPLDGGGGRVKATYLSRLAVELHGAATDLDNLSGQVRAEGADGDAYKKAAGVISKLTRRLGRPIP